MGAGVGVDIVNTEWATAGEGLTVHSECTRGRRECEQLFSQLDGLSSMQ